MVQSMGVLIFSTLDLLSIDKNMFFAQPVSRALVPDYYDIVRHPMDWQTMSEKLDRHEYPTAAAFKVSHLSR